MKLLNWKYGPPLIILLFVLLYGIIFVFGPARNMTREQSMNQLIALIQKLNPFASAELWANPDQLPSKQGKEGVIYFAMAPLSWLCGSNGHFHYKWDIPPYRNFVAPSLNLNEVHPVEREDENSSCLNMDVPDWESLKWIIKDLHKDFKGFQDFLQTGEVWLRWAGVIP